MLLVGLITKLLDYMDHDKVAKDQENFKRLLENIEKEANEERARLIKWRKEMLLEIEAKRKAYEEYVRLNRNDLALINTNLASDNMKLARRARELEEVDKLLDEYEDAIEVYEAHTGVDYEDIQKTLELNKKQKVIEQDNTPKELGEDCQRVRFR